MQRVCGCASNGMHWFNPTTRASSDRHSCSEPRREASLGPASGFADGYGCKVAGTLERHSAENEERGM